MGKLTRSRREVTNSRLTRGIGAWFDIARIRQREARILEWQAHRVDRLDHDRACLEQVRHFHCSGFAVADSDGDIGRDLPIRRWRQLLTQGELTYRQIDEGDAANLVIGVIAQPLRQRRGAIEHLITTTGDRIAVGIEWHNYQGSALCRRRHLGVQDGDLQRAARGNRNRAVGSRIVPG